MTDGQDSIETLLLDLHLRRLDPVQAARVEEALAASPELAAQSRGLRETLGALDRFEAPQPKFDLADRVLARIDQQTAVLPFRQPASAVPAGTAHDLSASPVLSLRELIAIAACIALFVGIFVPGYFKVQSMVMRNRCQENLRQVWAGMTSYANANDGQIASAGFIAGASWLPTRTPNVPRASNTAYVYKLVSGGYVRDTLVFICPAAKTGRPMMAENYRDFDDFAEPANNSYSYQYMNRPRPMRLSDLQEGHNRQMVLAADRNPLFDSNLPSQASPFDDESTNSMVHDNGAGQNAIYACGQGTWASSPTIGVERDNIYRAGRLSRYQGTEAPVCATDTFLVP